MIEVLGQDEVLNLFSKLAIKDKIPNSLICTGLKGVGKFSSALWLASLVNCTNSDINLRPCGRCPHCKKISQLNSVDIHVVEPDSVTLNLKIDQIRELVAESSFAPSELKKRIFIVKNAERMTDEAGNSILKVLEEPPKYLLFILTASDSSSVLPTILSRCTEIKFRDIPKDIIFDWLLKNKMTDEENAKLISSIAFGSIGVAEEYAKDPKKLEKRISFLDILTNIEKYSSFEISAKTSNLCSSLSDFFEINKAISLWLRDLMAVSVCKDFRDFVNIDFSEQIVKQSNIVSVSSLLAISELLKETVKKTFFNVNPSFLSDNLFRGISLILLNG